MSGTCFLVVFNRPPSFNDGFVRGVWKLFQPTHIQHIRVLFPKSSGIPWESFGLYFGALCWAVSILARVSSRLCVFFGLVDNFPESDVGGCKLTSVDLFSYLQEWISLKESFRKVGSFCGGKVSNASLFSNFKMMISAWLNWGKDTIHEFWKLLQKIMF